MANALPLLAADLTFIRVNGGRAFSGLVDWDEEDREPRVGEHVMVADGGDGPLEAVIEEIRPDGTIVLSVLAYAQRTQAAS
ncbi:MAG: hypothetical protein ACRDZ7_09880 [Acidimicrobiia bacterium]